MFETPEEYDTDSAAMLIQSLLSSQQSLTAVERFSQAHEYATKPLLEPVYRDLIDIEGLRDDEQLAFEVDLDVCSGCKACVVACHNLNGLDDGEVWRSVGLLTAGSHYTRTSYSPVMRPTEYHDDLTRPSWAEGYGRGPITLDTDGGVAILQPPPQTNITRPEAITFQHVTTACHHCEEPGCMKGCPVQAYEKDDRTGIVRHLDDQCIGCQYCTWMCPYNVPQYSHSKGIVRKCDMCYHRLEVGEAPACVQSCPNGAIRIRKVTRTTASINGAVASVGGSGSKSFMSSLVPDAPPSHLTKPTTRFVTKRDLRGTQAADRFVDTPEHVHWPLVWMLVLTQMSVGIALLRLASWWSSAPPRGTLPLALAVVSGVAGIGAATFHMGRPLYGFRSFLGLKTSWLSREVIAFGAYVPLLVLAWVAEQFNWPTLISVSVLGTAGLCGSLGVFSSVMIYAVTHRPFWRFRPTAIRFGLSMVSMASATMMTFRLSPFTASVLCVVAALSQMIFAGEHHGLFDPGGQPAIARSLKLLHGPLATATRLHFAGTIAQIVLAFCLMIGGGSSIAVALLSVAFATSAMDRYLFFAAVVPYRMPGSPAA